MKPNEIIGDMEGILKELGYPIVHTNSDHNAPRSVEQAMPTSPVGIPAFTDGTPAGSAVNPTGRNIILMDKASTWARGYHNLRALPVDPRSSHPTVAMGGQTVYRPLTFAENLQARITDARAHNNRTAESPSWGIWNDSCTAIIYGPDGQFKVQTVSSTLLSLPAEYAKASAQSQYDAITGNGVIELNRRNGKYNTALTQDEVLAHPFWQFVADGNADLLREYTDLQWEGRDAGYKGMAVYLRDNPQVGETRALYVYDRNVYSNAYGDLNLSINGSFLRVS